MLTDGSVSLGSSFIGFPNACLLLFSAIIMMMMMMYCAFIEREKSATQVECFSLL